MITIAEESTSFAKVSRPVDAGGLGFGFKWNMGWMHDSLGYIERDPAYRRYHHHEMTFSMVYAFDENFVLPISHDEVVYGKGSLIGKMPGDAWQQHANLRLYASFMFMHPGKKLNFMGNELGQYREWDHDGQLDWHLLDTPKHQQVQHLYRTLNGLYRTTPALHQQCHTGAGFSWLVHDDAERSLLAFVRHASDGSPAVYVVCNFTPTPHDDYHLPVADAGQYRVIYNSDAQEFGGSAYSQALLADTLTTNEQNMLSVSLPPLACILISPIA